MNAKMNLKNWVLILFSAVLLLPASNALAEEHPAIEPMQDYFDFVPFSGGAITQQQLVNFDQNTVQYIDTRQKDRFDASHIKGAINIEWREVLARRDDVSKSKIVVLYCDTGILSSKAHLALSVIGYENVRVLFGGYDAWNK